jgi:A/G-specific adenine glycosylase
MSEILEAASRVHQHLVNTEVAERDMAIFREAVLQFYHQSGRAFPWRDTADPYAILVSEIMLQQTQTDRVVPKYEHFLALFPTPFDLANAPISSLLEAWQGLGYNRRALALQRAAQKIIADYHGKMPRELDDLMSLPGIGPYTAAAVRAFAFNLPAACIETNIRRLFIYFFFPNQPDVKDKDLLPLITWAGEGMSPREWNYALMDVGSHLAKLVPNPNRRSAHYVLQSKFQGSNRQLRGRILKVLLGQRTMSVEELGLHLEVERERLEQTLAQLATEGFITSDGEMRGLA